jgi:hypothetical protein
LIKIKIDRVRISRKEISLEREGIPDGMTKTNLVNASISVKYINN